MNLKLIFAAAFTASVAIAGCDRDKNATSPPPAGGRPSTQPVKDQHEEKTVALGSQSAGGLTVKVSGSGLEAGDTAHLDVEVSGAEKPKAVRAWVGNETATDAVKDKVKDEQLASGDYHMHVDVPEPLPAGSKLWIEFETAAGTQKVSFDLKK